MHVVVEEVRRYVLSGHEDEWASMRDYTKEVKAKIVKEVRNERLPGHSGIVMYAERLLRKPKRRRAFNAEPV